MSRGLKPFIVKHSITNRDTKSVSLYFKDINQIQAKPIEKKQELELFMKYKNGCSISAEKIIHANLRFVITVAKQYDRGNPCLQLMDLVQLGNVGMLKAVEKYDPDSGNKFISFAIWYIRQSILSGLKDTSSKIRIPQNARNIQQKQEKFIEQYYAEYGCIPTEKEIAEELEVNENMIKDINKCAFQKSLDAPLTTEEGSSALSELLPSDRSDFSEAVFSDDVKLIVNSLLCKLTEVEQHAIKGFFGIDCYPKSLETLQKETQRTKEGLRQILKRAIRKMKIRTLNHKEQLIQFA